MRLLILAAFLCPSTMAFCQSTAPSLVSSDNQSKSSSAAPLWADFDDLPSTRQLRIGRQTVLQPKTSVSPQSGEASTDPLLAQNFPVLPNLANLSPDFAFGPIPMVWPNAKLEPIPTIWPGAKLLGATAKPGASASMQGPTK